MIESNYHTHRQYWLTVYIHRVQNIVEDLAKLCGRQEDVSAQAAADAKLECLWMEVTGVLFSTMVHDEAMRHRIFTLPLLPDAQPPQALPGREFWCSVTVRRAALTVPFRARAQRLGFGKSA